MSFENGPATFGTFLRSAKIFGPVLRQCWGIALLSCLLFRFLDQYFLWLGDQQDDTGRVITAVASFLVGLIYSLWLSLVIPYFVSLQTSGGVRLPKRQTVWQHIAYFASPLTIESLRVLGKLIVGFVLLIIPGVIRIFSYYFVSYVVQFDPRYDAGRKDALSASKELWQKGRRIYPLAVIFILFVIDAGWSFSTMKVTFFNSPVLFCVFSFLEMALEIYSACAIFLLYIDLRDRSRIAVYRPHE